MSTTKKSEYQPLVANGKYSCQVGKRDDVPQATKAAELIRIAIELEEDQVFDTIASERDIEKVKFVSHKKHGRKF